MDQPGPRIIGVAVWILVSNLGGAWRWVELTRSRPRDWPGDHEKGLRRFSSKGEL
jgi:hypothetical protein